MHTGDIIDTHIHAFVPIYQSNCTCVKTDDSGDYSYLEYSNKVLNNKSSSSIDLER